MECERKTKHKIKSVLKETLHVLFICLFLTIVFIHMDFLLESVWNMGIKTDPELYPLIFNITEGCHTDTCVIYRVNEWVYHNVKINVSDGGMFDFVTYSPQKIIKYGGVCRHKTALALSMLKTVGINYCKFRVRIVIDNGPSRESHAWFECRMKHTTLECDPTFGYCYTER